MYRNYANLPRPLKKKIIGTRMVTMTDFGPDVTLNGPSIMKAEKFVPSLDVMLQIEEKYKKLEEKQRLDSFNIPNLPKNTKFNG